MDGQKDAEPGAGEKLEQQREHAEEEWRLWQGGQLRSSLLLVSAVAQWVLLLACLIYLGVHFLRPSKRFVPRGSPLPPCIAGRSTRGAAVNLSAESGPIQIRNGSVLVPCDGLYLLSLRSTIYLEEEDWLNLTLQASSSVLWE
ncbi:TNFL4 factor, partial [Rhodinocichla rosea]|nr:TNFL4 factor [Rhodinocichla rosea]